MNINTLFNSNMLNVFSSHLLAQCDKVKTCAMLNETLGNLGS